MLPKSFVGFYANYAKMGGGGGGGAGAGEGSVSVGGISALIHIRGCTESRIDLAESPHSIRLFSTRTARRYQPGTHRWDWSEGCPSSDGLAGLSVSSAGGV